MTPLTSITGSHIPRTLSRDNNHPLQNRPNFYTLQSLPFNDESQNVAQHGMAINCPQCCGNQTNPQNHYRVLLCIILHETGNRQNMWYPGTINNLKCQTGNLRNVTEEYRSPGVGITKDVPVWNWHTKVWQIWCLQSWIAPTMTLSSETHHVNFGIWQCAKAQTIHLYSQTCFKWPLFGEEIVCYGRWWFKHVILSACSIVMLNVHVCWRPPA